MFVTVGGDTDMPSTCHDLRINLGPNSRVKEKLWALCLVSDAHSGQHHGTARQHIEGYLTSPLIETLQRDSSGQKLLSVLF